MLSTRKIHIPASNVAKYAVARTSLGSIKNGFTRSSEGMCAKLKLAIKLAVYVALASPPARSYTGITELLC